MNNEGLSADIVEVIERGFFKTEHIFGVSDEILGLLNLNAGKTKGKYTSSDGKHFDFERINFWKSQYQFSESGVALGNAAAQGFFKRSLAVVFENENYFLVPGGSPIRSWRLVDSREQILAKYKPRGAFKRGAQIRIINPLPYALLVFGYCLVSKRWQEQSS